MKRIIVLTMLLFLAFSLGLAQDTSVTLEYQTYYVDSLKSSAYPITTGNGSPRDTVDVKFSLESGFDYYQITAWSAEADTLVISVCAPDASRFVQRAVINLASGATAASMVTSTTVVDFALAGGGQDNYFRFTSPGSTNTLHFIVAGKKGIPEY
jgi:hypothetical protein